jgi:hypothetical protein
MVYALGDRVELVPEVGGGVGFVTDSLAGLVRRAPTGLWRLGREAARTTGWVVPPVQIAAGPLAPPALDIGELTLAQPVTLCGAHGQNHSDQRRACGAAEIAEAGVRPEAGVRAEAAGAEALRSGVG